MNQSPNQLQRLHARLDQRRAELLAKIDSHKVHRSDGATHLRTHRDETDDDAMVDAMDTREIDDIARDTRELASVEAALQRMAGGRYGQCVECGAALTAERLEAVPDAAFCLPCQVRLERRQ
jgi:RNA polymerase-binding transcription factor DksA